MHEREQAALDALVDAVRPVTDGELASYIPELGQVNPDRVAIAVVDGSGTVFSGGDDEVTFTIQSIAKAFAFALAISTHGRESVLERVGVEASGQPFDALSFEPRTGRPYNPMVNSGAIAVSALAAGDTVETKTAALVEFLSDCAGRDLSIDEKVRQSELATAERNRAFGHLLAADGMIDCPAHVAVESYIAQCAVEVDTRDVAIMAATLAFDGVNPVTGQKVMDRRTARDVVSVMTSCGMYDASGSWLLRVGLPAKSGVGGGIVAVDPDSFGIATFSPRLDQFGNSVRGVRMLELASERLGLHMLDNDHHRLVREG